VNKRRHTQKRGQALLFIDCVTEEGEKKESVGKKKQYIKPNQTVLKGSINFTGRGAASAREGGVEGWDTLGLLERGSGTPRVAIQGREHSPEGALLSPIVDVSLQLAESAHGAAHHRVVVTQDGALVRKHRHVKNSGLRTHRATRHRLPPQPTTDRDVVAGAVQRPHGHAASTQAELVHSVGHLAAQARITEGSTDACGKRREGPSSQPDPGQEGSTATLPTSPQEGPKTRGRRLLTDAAVRHAVQQPCVPRAGLWGHREAGLDCHHMTGGHGQGSAQSVPGGRLVG